MKGKIGSATHFTKGWKIESSAKEDGRCPSCCSNDLIILKGILIRRKGLYGDFLGCSRFPDCRYTAKAIDLRQIKNKKVYKKLRRKLYHFRSNTK